MHIFFRCTAGYDVLLPWKSVHRNVKIDLLSWPVLAEHPQELSAFGTRDSSYSCQILVSGGQWLKIFLHQKVEPLILLPGDIQIKISRCTHMLMISARPFHSLFGSGIKTVCQKGSFAKSDWNMSNFLSLSVLQLDDVNKAQLLSEGYSSLLR